ncbi:MAG: alpha/beta hydrolase [Sulfitobacter sp.]
MTSLRLRIIGAIIRPGARAMMTRAQDPNRLRRVFDLSSRLFFRRVRGAVSTPVADPQSLPLGGLWVSAGKVAPRPVILYFHGGGYLAGSPNTHRHMAARLSQLSGLKVFLPQYRLAPEHPLPACLDDADAAYAYLRTQGYAARDIILGGDSAGGGIALSLLSKLCKNGQHPAACFAWSPFCDQTFSGASVRENGRIDHFFPGDRVHDLADMILGDTAADDPRVSPLFAEFPDCPPVLIQASQCEILRDDAVRMVKKLADASADAQVDLWDNAPHVWQIFDGWFPEARAAIAKTAQFLSSRMPQKDEN